MDESGEKHTKRVPTWLAWIGVLPAMAAVWGACFVLAIVSAFIFEYFGKRDPDDWSFAPLLMNGLSGFAMVGAAVAVAPAGKKTVGYLADGLVLFIWTTSLITRADWMGRIYDTAVIVGAVISIIGIAQDKMPFDSR